MAFKDLMKSIEGVFSRVSADITRRPDGGTSHYRPLRKKTAEAQPGDMTQMQGQDPRFVHTGFTGMNPPVNYGGYEQGTFGQTAYGQTAYDQTAYGQTMYGQTAYGQTAFNQTAFGQTAYGQQQGTSYFPQQDQAAQQDYVGKGSFSGTGFTMAQRNNISYMPGVEPRMERGQVHVEHIITLTGLKSCYEAIECMKDGETLIVMLDSIANESESMRCQDMLAGAAFTLGCSVRLLQGARIVVIAPEGVKILPEQNNTSGMMPGGMMRPPEMMAAPANEPTEVPFQGRRERRTSANAADWNAARNGELQGYNPYTGTMPVAAGAYGSFGGYGY
ncbi:MAG: cell division protein SepF [Clostridia bacterium]|nr:cell division protein SepF [Clostridia bacterium]